MNLEFRFIFVIVTLIPGFHKKLLQIKALFISRMTMNLMVFHTPHRGQALSAPLCMLQIPGSNPGPVAWPGWLFFRGFATPSHLDMSTGHK
jgi:hypothetical protein